MTSPACSQTIDGGAAGPDLVEAVDRLAGDACVTGPPTTYAEADVQPLVSSAGEPAGVVLLAPGGTSVRLTEAMWVSFQAIAGLVRPRDAVAYRGYPTAVEQLADPMGVVVRLDRGGILVGPRDDTQMFWIPARVLGLWQERGGITGDLGFPTTNLYLDEQGLHLDFEHGAMHAYGDTAAVAEIIAGGPVSPVVELHDPATASARTGDVADAIIRQANGTSWWVDDEGTRHWIPGRRVWDCLGGAGELAVDGLHGWEVAALPLGAAATCPRRNRDRR